MPRELYLEINIGRISLNSTVKFADDGSCYFFPISEPKEFRHFHLSIHGGIDDELKRADPYSVAEQLRAMKRLIPYKIHAKVGRLRLPRSPKDVHLEEMFGLWNEEEWHEEDFLFVSSELLRKQMRPEIHGSAVTVRFDGEEFYRQLFRSLRVVGGREIERAKEDSALRRAGVFHPNVGMVMHPVVVRIVNESASMGISDETFRSREIQAVRTRIEAITGGNMAQEEMGLQNVVMDALAENREVMRFMMRTASRIAQGSSLAPPKPIWTPLSKEA